MNAKPDETLGPQVNQDYLEQTNIQFVVTLIMMDHMAQINPHPVSYYI